MKLILLTGLVAVEKRDLALELALHYGADGLAVTLVDNIARMPIDPEFTGGETLVRVDGDITHFLADMLPDALIDVVIAAVSETMPPDTLFAAVEQLQSMVPAVEVQTIALIDMRTCDCFPTLRETLERHANTVVMLPYELPQVLEKLA
jgi:hypothetical protein